MTAGLRPRFRAWIRASPVRGAIFIAVEFPLAMSLFFLVYFGPDRPPMPLLGMAVMLIVLGAISGFWIYKRTKHLYPMSPPAEDAGSRRTSQMFARLSDRFLLIVLVVAGLSCIWSVVCLVTGYYSYGRWTEAVSIAIMALTFWAAVGERRRRQAAPSGNRR